MDAAIAAGRDPGPLAGLPFAVKNLFDVAGITTLAGSKINRERPPAVRDARAVAALRRAGAVLLGALNMDEYAYGFTDRELALRPVRNPHDPTRVAGGSSGDRARRWSGARSRSRWARTPTAPSACPRRSAASSGSSRPMGACPGRAPRSSRRASTTWAARPLGARRRRRLRRHAGARSGRSGLRQRGPPSRACPRWPTASRGCGSRWLDGHFARGASPRPSRRVGQVARGARRLPASHDPRGAPRAGRRHGHHGVRRRATPPGRSPSARPQDFDPLTRDRFLAGALVPAASIVQAQRFRAWYRARVRELFREVDVLLAPTTPCPAPRSARTRSPGRRRGPGQAQPRRLHPAAVLHRSPGALGPGREARAAAAGRAARRRALPGGRRAPGRRAARGEGRGCGRGDRLMRLTISSLTTITSTGHDAITAFRHARPNIDLRRTLANTVHTVTISHTCLPAQD